MEAKATALKAVAGACRTEMRVNPFVALTRYFYPCSALLNEIKEAVEKRSHEHRSIVACIVRSEVLDVTLEALEAIGNVRNSLAVRECTPQQLVELSFFSIQDVLSVMVAVPHDMEPFIDQNVAEKILFTIERVGSTFHDEIQTEIPFPTFILAQPLYLISSRFPSLPVSAMKRHLLQSLIPRNKFLFDEEFLQDIVAKIHKVLLCGPEPLSLDVVVDFLLKHKPSEYNVSNSGVALSLPVLVIQLAMWASKTKSEKRSIAAQTKLIDWSIRAIREAQPSCHCGAPLDCCMEVLLPLLCFCALTISDDGALLASPLSRTMFSVPAELWHLSTGRFATETGTVTTAFLRIVDLAAIEVEDGELDAAMKQWIHDCLLSPLAPQLLPFDLATLLSNHDPHSKLLRHMLKAPKLLASALLITDISTTKLHHVMAFALMVQIECLVRGAHSPLFFPFVKSLEEETGKRDAAKCLLDAVNYACALFASQGYNYDEQFPLNCAACCAGCGPSVAHDAHCCSGCKLTPYCSASCQRQHWLQHRESCHAISEFERWIADRASQAKHGTFASHICASCAKVAGPKLYCGGVHGQWPTTLNGETMSRCSRCKQTSYCSKECQVKHWKTGHKEECLPLTK